GPPFTAIVISTLLARLSTRLRSVFIGISDHSSKSALVRPHTDAGREGLAFMMDGRPESLSHYNSTMKIDEVTSCNMNTVFCLINHPRDT
uniref:Uncharacterized protein n=1 Tax=Oryzias latipes TaxID=8090 RepID=A0A3P9M0C4_ORYLA